MDKTQELSSLKRGLKAVALLNTLGSITIAELGRQLKLPRTTAERIRVTTDPETTLYVNRRHVGSSGPMGQVSSGIAFLAFSDPVQREILLEMLRRSDNPDQAGVHDKPRLDYLFEKARADGHCFGLDHGRERSVAVPVMLGGRVRGALLMPFMARVLTNDAAVETYVPRLKVLAQRIEAAVGGDEGGQGSVDASLASKAILFHPPLKGEVSGDA